LFPSLSQVAPYLRFLSDCDWINQTICYAKRYLRFLCTSSHICNREERRKLWSMFISWIIWLKREQQEESSFLWLGDQLRLRPYRLTGVLASTAATQQGNARGHVANATYLEPGPQIPHSADICSRPCPPNIPLAATDGEYADTSSQRLCRPLSERCKLLQQGDNPMEIFWLFKMAAGLPIQHF
jgi:hypothetical protein